MNFDGIKIAFCWPFVKIFTGVNFEKMASTFWVHFEKIMKIIKKMLRNLSANVGEILEQF